MSDAAIAALQKRNEELTAQVADLNSEGKRRRLDGKKLAARNAELEKQVTTLATERDTLKTKSESTPNELQTEVDRLKGEITTRDHKDAFRGVSTFKAKSKDDKGADVEKEYQLADGVSVDTLWKQLEYKAEGDAPKAESIQESLGKALGTHGFLFREKAVDATSNAAPGGAQSAIRTQAATAGPGTGRSANHTSQLPSATSRIDAAFSSLGKDRPAGRLA